MFLRYEVRAMPARLVIFLFLLLTGTAKLYMWLGVTDPLKAVIAATLTTFVIICGLRRSGQKRDEQKNGKRQQQLKKKNPVSPGTRKDETSTRCRRCGLPVSRRHRPYPARTPRTEQRTRTGRTRLRRELG